MIAFDIDGVLADATHREHHLASRPKDWDAFFAAAANDPAIETGRTALHSAADRDVVILVSGRPERLRSLTVDWLQRHGFGSPPVYLRADDDRRPAAAVKSEILSALGGPQVITEVHDDDPQVCAALEQQGYRVQRVTLRARSGPVSTESKVS